MGHQDPPPRGRLLVNPFTRRLEPPPPPSRGRLLPGPWTIRDPPRNKPPSRGVLVARPADQDPPPPPRPHIAHPINEITSSPAPAPAPTPSPSSPPPPAPKYHAFISFRGADVRQTFLSHLFAHMHNQKYICTFKDDLNLKRGDEISPTLDAAIEGSSSYVVIFSPNYATSDWCLDELVKILDCARRHKRKVIPVFYDGVTPSHVRNLKGGYADAFAEHEKKKVAEVKLKSWRAALKEAANVAGFSSEDTKPERHLVEKITETILGAIRQKFSPIKEGLVGIDQEIEDVEKLLNIDDKQQNRIIGFWGMPGIGKTTLAKAMLHKIDPEKFQGVHFIQNFAAQLKRTEVIDLQNELFYKLLDDDEKTYFMPTDLKLERLGRVRSFVVIDDVTSIGPLKELLHGNLCNLFGPGSRIILTSTDRQVLKNVCQEVHQVKGLDEDKALQLLSSYAFKKDQPPSEFMERCKKIVSYAQGNPLALRVLGSTLFDRSMEYWDGTLDKLRSIPNKEIEDLLMISYDGLSEDEQIVFLDLACFFNHEDYNFVTRVLDGDLVWNLIDKSLVRIDGSKGELEMHALLEDLGKKIVKKEKGLGKRSRLWDAKDSQTLLSRNKGSDATEGILLNLSETTEKTSTKSETFERMTSLRLLWFRLGLKKKLNSNLVLSLSDKSKKVVVSDQGPKFLSDELRFLQWDLCQATSLPSDFSPRNLHVLRLRHSNIRQLWEGGNVDLGNLKELNLFASKYLTKLPDLSTAKKLEVIDLTSCTSLVDQLHDSIIYLPKLQTLILNSCGSLILNNLDDDQHHANNNDQAFPSLEVANLDKTQIKQVPYLIKSAPRLSKLSCSSCPNITNFPEVLQSMEGLLELNLSYCEGISSIPDTIRILSSLENLDLSGTGIEQVPSSILDLRRLVVLRYAECKKLVTAPASFKKLLNLKVLDDSHCDLLINKDPELPDTLEYVDEDEDEDGDEV